MPWRPHRLNLFSYCAHNDVLRQESASNGYDCYPRNQRVMSKNSEDLNEKLCLVEDADSPRGRSVLRVQKFQHLRAVDELCAADLSQ